MNADDVTWSKATTMSAKYIVIGADIYVTEDYLLDMIDDLIYNNEIFEDLDKQEVVDLIFKLYERLPPRALDISEDELKKRIEKIMMVEVMSRLGDEDEC